MSTTLAVLLAGVLVAVILVVAGVLAGRRGSPRDAADVEPIEHWLIDSVVAHPRLHRLLVSVDRRVVGGAVVAVGFVIVLFAAMIVGWVFDTVDTTRGFARWDQAVAEWGSDHASDTAASVMRAVTQLGGTWLLLVVMTVVGLVDWRRRRDTTSLWFLLIVGVGVSTINNGLKLLIMRERPPVRHLVDAAGSSFPSGHSAASAACWMAIALVVGRWCGPKVRPWLSVVAVGIACLVAASRALLGVHWVTDVVAGLTVGWAWFLIVAIAFGGRLQHLGEPAEQLAALQIDDKEKDEAHHGN